LAETVAPRVYQVTVLPGGERFGCAANQPLLNAAHAANILISYSCRGGRCGSCLGRVVDGEVVYPGGLPEALSEAQQASGFALFCSAYALSDLSIELLQPEFPA